MPESTVGLSEIEVERARRWAARAALPWLLLAALLVAAEGALLAARDFLSALLVGVGGVLVVVPLLVLALMRGARVRRLGAGAPTVLLEGRYTEPRGRRATRRLGGQLIELAAASPPPPHDTRVRARAIALDARDAQAPPGLQQSWLVIEWLP
jgi:hypothetical protein